MNYAIKADKLPGRSRWDTRDKFGHGNLYTQEIWENGYRRHQGRVYTAVLGSVPYCGHYNNLDQVITKEEFQAVCK